MPSRPHSRNVRGGRSPLTGALKGAVAGAAGVWVMDQVGWWMWDREDPRALRQEERARVGGMDPAHVIANRVAGAMGTRLVPRQPHPAGIAVHYAIGVMPAMIYAPLRRQIPGLGGARGLLYGLALFLAVDEALTPVLGVAGGPSEYPWQAHARGLATHLILGAVTDGVLDLLD